MTANSDSELVSENGDLRVAIAGESGVSRDLSIEVEASHVRKAFDRAYRELRRSAQVRGFRPGKVPRSVLERLYGASVVEEIERILVTETLPDALALAQLEPLVEPTIEADKPALDAAFCYRAHVEVKPEIELPDLTSLSAQRPKVEVTDAEVDERMQDLRRRNAPLVEEPEDTEAELGHTLSIDFQGSVDGEVFEGGTGENLDVELGSGRLMPGFEEQLVGARAGEDRRVEVRFPSDYTAEELRDKDAEFEVHVNSVRKSQPPELDDEFAKDVGDFETLDDLRMRMRSDLTQLRQQAGDAVMRRSLLDSLIEKTDCEVPAGVVERQLMGQISSMQKQYEGKVPDEMLRTQLMRMAEEGRSGAERRVREAFLLEAVARAEDLEVAEEDLDLRLDEMAKEQGIPVPQMRKLAETRGIRDAIRAEMLEDKALAFLASQATVEEIEDAEKVEDVEEVEEVEDAEKA
jgi:trigger factor